MKVFARLIVLGLVVAACGGTAATTRTRPSATSSGS